MMNSDGNTTTTTTEVNIVYINLLNTYMYIHFKVYKYSVLIDF